MKWIKVSKFIGMPDAVRTELSKMNIEDALYLHSGELDGDLLDFLLIRYYSINQSSDVRIYHQGTSAMVIGDTAKLISDDPYKLVPFRIFADDYKKTVKQNAVRGIVRELKNDGIDTDSEKVMTICNKHLHWTFNHRCEPSIDRQLIKDTLTKKL